MEDDGQFHLDGVVFERSVDTLCLPLFGYRSRWRLALCWRCRNVRQGSWAAAHMFQSREPKPVPVPGASDDHLTCSWCGGSHVAAPPLPSRAQIEAAADSCAGWLSAALRMP